MYVSVDKDTSLKFKETANSVHLINQHNTDSVKI